MEFTAQSSPGKPPMVHALDKHVALGNIPKINISQSPNHIEEARIHTLTGQFNC